MANRLLLVFLKNQVLGTVKTRLAADVGEARALEVYNKLVQRTVEAARGVNAHRQLWFSSYIPRKSIGTGEFEQRLQVGEDLGQRMSYAFRQGFSDGFKKIVIIGSDCPGISQELIEQAFQQLDSCDAVVGPSEDGGYYLLGCRASFPFLFEKMSWSTQDVFSETISRLKQRDLSYGLLPELNDIDTAEDLERSGFA